MDNASKALVMAGAILIAVMLISLGVLLFTRAQDIADNTSNQLDSLAVQAYNSGYIDFAGSNVKGSAVKQIINKVNSHNGNEREVSLYGKINMTGGGSLASNLSLSSIDTSKYYTVDVSYDSEADGEYKNTVGAINKVVITPKAST